MSDEPDKVTRLEADLKRRDDVILEQIKLIGQVRSDLWAALERIKELELAVEREASKPISDLAETSRILARMLEHEIAHRVE